MEEENIRIVYRRYPSLVEAQKRYYEKKKDTDTYKAKQNETSKSYYLRNKEMVLEKARERYKKQKELLKQQQEDEFI